MSKTALRKHLRTMTAEDLAALVMEVYEARKEAKEYLEYYLNPDIDSKLDNALEAVTKELERGKKRRYAPRISHVKAAVKLFVTYGPEPEMVFGLMERTLTLMVTGANKYYLSGATVRGMAGFITFALKVMTDVGVGTGRMPELLRVAEKLSPDYTDSRSIREEWEEAINAHISGRMAAESLLVN